MMNPYAFAWNDPINFSDPSGLDPCRADFCITNTGPGGDPPSGGLAGVAAWGIYRAFFFFRDFWSGSPQSPSGGPHVVIPDVVSGTAHGTAFTHRARTASWSPPAKHSSKPATAYEGWLLGFRKAIGVMPLSPVSAPVSTSVELGDVLARDMTDFVQTPRYDPKRIYLSRKIEGVFALAMINAFTAGSLPSLGAGAKLGGTATAQGEQAAANALAKGPVLDTNVVISHGKQYLGSGAVKSVVSEYEIAALVARGKIRGAPAAAQGIPSVPLPGLDLRIMVRGLLKVGTRGNFADGIIGATALERGVPLVTSDKVLGAAIKRLGGIVLKP